MTHQNLTEATWRETRAAARDAIAVLPIGSQEQHAGHLPMGTDTMLADAVVGRALDLLAEEAGPDTVVPDLVRLPTLPYGHSPHHLFAAALTLSAPVLGTVLDELLDSLAECGYGRVLVVNGHGGNDEIVRLAVKRFALRAEVTAAACSYWTLLDTVETEESTVETEESTVETAHSTVPDAGADRDKSGTAVAPCGAVDRAGLVPGHAGWFETSLMLAAYPELVRAERPAQPPVEPPPLFDKPPYPGLTVERHGEWERVGGATDDAAGADARDGARLLDRCARGLARAVLAFDAATRPTA
ncbi:creatininase family protein [Streptomyces sp. NPDC058686]|uniref:creatininase family protein n=1 Tax=Streptomyces sp. NPDC058686 TaxID=3346599 RepID=UPI003668CE96